MGDRINKSAIKNYKGPFDTVWFCVCMVESVTEEGNVCVNV